MGAKRPKSLPKKPKAKKMNNSVGIYFKNEGFSCLIR